MNEHLPPGAVTAAERSDLPVDPAYLALLRSDRVSDRLREELLRRAEPDPADYRPRALSNDQLATLRALCERVVPQSGAAPIDLAARLDAMMADATGNGWRYEALPSDPDAYRLGLDTLDALARDRQASGFAGLSPEARDALLTDIQNGKAGRDGDANLLSADQMTLWFEEMRSDTTRLYVAHPQTLARMGYSGIANGGRGGAAFTGFQRVGIDEREAFEPEPSAPLAETMR